MQYGILLGFFAGAHYERQRYLHTEQWEHVSILSKASPYILPFVAGDGLRFLFMGIAKASLLVFLVGLVMFLVQVGAILYTMGIGRNRINQTPLPQQQ